MGLQNLSEAKKLVWLGCHTVRRDLPRKLLGRNVALWARCVTCLCHVVLVQPRQWQTAGAQACPSGNPGAGLLTPTLKTPALARHGPWLSGSLCHGLGGPLGGLGCGRAGPFLLLSCLQPQSRDRVAGLPGPALSLSHWAATPVCG